MAWRVLVQCWEDDSSEVHIEWMEDLRTWIWYALGRCSYWDRRNNFNTWTLQDSVFHTWVKEDALAGSDFFLLLAPAWQGRRVSPVLRIQ